MDYIVFGDTGGHFTQLYNGLIDIGMTQDYVLPKNTTIVHCGDLVHKGPASMEILHMIDEVKEKNPDQWVQIIGNHEAQYLGGIVFKHVGVLDEEGTGILKRWDIEGFLKFTYTIPATALITTESDTYRTDKPIVVSHSGISRPFWDKFLAIYDPSSYNEIIRGLNPEDKYMYGFMVEGTEYDPFKPTGTTWSHGIHESWLQWDEHQDITFNQIVGHIYPYNFNEKSFFEGTEEEFINVSHLHEKEHLTIAPILHDKSAWMVFTDPGYMRTAHHDTQPSFTIKGQ